MNWRHLEITYKYHIASNDKKLMFQSYEIGLGVSCALWIATLVLLKILANVGKKAFTL